MEFSEDFKNPPVSCRIKPFWFWNGDMTKEEIQNQIREMALKGLGGMFICARQGMTVPYLSKQWFDLTEFACDVAKEYGLEAWLYDEYPYPSGMSGGEVLLEHPEAIHMVLHHKAFYTEGETEFETVLGWMKILYAKAIPVLPDKTVDWSRALDLKDSIGTIQTEKIYQKTGLTKYNNKRFFSYGPEKVLKIRLLKGKWRIEIYAEASMGDFKYYGGFFDPCNKDAVKTFIETTHERYQKAVGSRFGNSIHGMFSDEVGLLSPIPWTKLLPKEFKQRNGYDLLECLPALHDNQVKNAAKIRYDLYETIHELFCDSYHKQVSDWCQSHHLLYATEVPSMRMGTQKYSDIIGGDTAHEKLGKPLEWIYDEYIRNYRSNAKSVSSLARQLNRKYAMIESFHSVGWTMTLQDAKWMIDRLGCQGINLYNFHAFYYTIQDITKHDAPPSQFLQNPYWKHYRKLADYVGRMGVMVTNTEADISIAILDPAAALFTKLANPFHGFPYCGESLEEQEECDRLRKDWVHICKTLLFAQIDYDHLDAHILEEATIEGGKIRIGRAEYSVVILPPCHCMEGAAREKLEEFVSQGGCLIGMGMLPHVVIDRDQNPEKSWKALFEKETAHFLPCKAAIKMAGFEKQLIDLCLQYGQMKLKIEVVSGSIYDVISCQRHDREGNRYVFLGNQGAGRVKVKVSDLKDRYLKWTAKRCCLEDGKFICLPVENDILTVELQAFESWWVCLSVLKTDTIQERDEETALKVITIPFSGEKKVSIEGKNICRFASVDMTIDGKEWKRTEVKTFVEQCAGLRILGKENLTFSGDFGTPRKIRPAYPIKCTYRAAFESDFEPEDISLFMDRETISGEHSIFVNDVLIEKDAWRSLFVNDFNNMEADVHGLVHAGTNEIRIESMIERDEDGLRDPFYLRGTFGVEGCGSYIRLRKMPEKTFPDSTFVKGFPYYSGTITFTDELDGESLISGQIPETFYLALEFEKPVYDCLEVVVNSHSLGVKAFAPFYFPCCREFLKESKNQMEVKLTNTLANMLDGTYFDYENHKLVNIEEE